MRNLKSIKKLFSKYENNVDDISRFVFENNNLNINELEEIVEFIYNDTDLNLDVFRERYCVLKRREVVLENDPVELFKIKGILCNEDINRKLYIENGLDVSRYINDECIAKSKAKINRAQHGIKYILNNDLLKNNILNISPQISARRSVSDINDMVCYIKNDKILDINIINKCPNILSRCNKDRIDKIKSIFVDRGVDISYLNDNPEIFISNSNSTYIEEIIDTFSNIKELSLDYVLANPVLIQKGNVSIMKKLINFFKDQEGFGFEYIKKCPKALLSSDYDMTIKKFNYVLNDKRINNDFLWNHPYFINVNSNDDISDYITYFANSSFLDMDDFIDDDSIVSLKSVEEIDNLVKYLTKKLLITDSKTIKFIVRRRYLSQVMQIVDFIENETSFDTDFIRENPTILARRKVGVLRSNYNILSHKLHIPDEKIAHCVTCLTYGRTGEIEKLYNLIKKNEELDTAILSDCLTILAKGTVSSVIDIINYFKDESKLGIDILNQCPSLLSKTTVDKVREIEEYFANSEQHSLDELRKCPSIFMGTTCDNIIDVDTYMGSVGLSSLLDVSKKIYSVKCDNIEKIYDICNKFSLLDELQNTVYALRCNPEVFYARIMFLKDNDHGIVYDGHIDKKIINYSKDKFRDKFGISNDELLSRYPYDSKKKVKTNGLSD